MSLNFSMQKESLHVYLDDHALKMACVRQQKSGPCVTGIFYKKITGLSVQDLAETLRAGCVALNAKTRLVYGIISSGSAITKSIEVPSLDEKEIADIIRLQAGRHTPYSKDEVIVGHFNIGVVLERYTKSLLVIVSNQTVERFTTAIALAGMQLEAVHLASEIFARSALRTPQVGPAEEPTALLVMDMHASDFIVVQNDRPCYIRNIPMGFQHLGEMTVDALGQFLQEVRKTIDAYQAEGFERLPSRMLIGGIPQKWTETVRKAMQDEFKIETHPVSMEEIAPVLPQVKEEIDKNAPVSFLEVLLDAVLLEDIMIDLTPAEVKIQKAFRRRGHDIFMSGIMMIVIFVLTMSVFLVKLYFRGAYLGTLEHNFEIKSREVDSLVAISDRSRLIKDFKAKKGRVAQIIREVETLLPEGMYLKQITLDNTGKLTLGGTSELMSTVFSFVTQFENDPLFQTVKTEYTKSRKEGEQDVADFGITAQIEDGTSVARAGDAPAAADGAKSGDDADIPPGPPSKGGSDG